MTHHNSIPRTSHELIYGQPQERPIITKPRVIGALAVGLAAAAAFGYSSHEAAPVAAPAPQEMHIEGEVDMGAVYNDVKSQITSPYIENMGTIKQDSTGVNVITVGEYIPTPGQKVVGDKAEFVNIAPPSLRQAGGIGEKLDEVIATDAPILNALSESGKLGAIRFNMAVDPNEESLKDTPAGDMRFLAAGTEHAEPSAAVIEYTLPAKGKVPMNTIATMTNHEAAHIDQRNLNIVNKSDPIEHVSNPELGNADVDAYRADMAVLRNASIDVAEQSPEVIVAAKKLLAVNAHAKGPAAKEDRKIAKSILDGTFSDLQPTTENPSIAGEFIINEGRVDTPSFVFARNDKASEYYSAHATLKQKAASEELDAAFTRAIKSPDSPLSLFDESSYGNPDIYGHPESNTPELIGSAENILLTYPQKFAAKIKRFPAAIQQTVLRFTKRLNADTQNANAAGGASQDLRKRLNDNMEWVEKTVTDIGNK